MMRLPRFLVAMPDGGSMPAPPLAAIERISWFSLAFGIAVAIFYGLFIHQFSFLIFVAVILGMSAVVWAAGERSSRTRFLLAIFLAALALRLLSTILFHNAGRIAGDPLSASPDA